jgi:hypothetical protein
MVQTSSHLVQQLTSRLAQGQAGCMPSAQPVQALSKIKIKD